MPLLPLRVKKIGKCNLDAFAGYYPSSRWWSLHNKFATMAENIETEPHLLLDLDLALGVTKPVTGVIKRIIKKSAARDDVENQYGILHSSCLG